MANRNAATHKGTCQCCGAVQMLPAGVLAKHGYTVKWGFFSGTCQGSGELPFEKSCALVQRFIGYAQTKLAELEAFKASLLERPAEGTTEAWRHVYRSGNRLRVLNGYEWMKVPVVFTTHTDQSDGHQWMTLQYQHPDRPAGQLDRLDIYDVRSLDPLDYVAALNQKRATALEADIKQVHRYITWQQQRVARWKEADLLPR